MRTVVRVGVVILCGAFLCIGTALAAGGECGKVAGAACCPADATHATTYCINGLTCRAATGICESAGGGGGAGGDLTLNNPLGVNTIDEAILKVLDLLKTVGAPIAVVMVIIGGFQMLFAAGDPEKFKSGQKTILYSAIGYAIIFLADGIATLIQNVLA